MAEQSSPLQFEDVPLDQARRMRRGPRMEPMLYETLRQKIQSLSSEAVRINLGPELTANRMKNYLLSIARDLDVPVQTSPKFPRIWLAKPTLCRGTNILPRTRYRPCRSKRQNIDGKRVGKSLFKRQQNS
jgi:hypothetical protein